MLEDTAAEESAYSERQALYIWHLLTNVYLS